MSASGSYDKIELRAFLQALIAAPPAEFTTLVMDNFDKFRATMKLAHNTAEDLKNIKAAYKQLYDEETRILDHNDELLKVNAQLKQHQPASLMSSKPTGIPLAATAAPHPAPTPTPPSASPAPNGVLRHWETHRYIHLSLEELQIIRPNASRTVLSHFKKTEANQNPTSRVRLTAEEFTTLDAMRPIRKGKPRFKYMGAKKSTKADVDGTNTSLQGGGGMEDGDGAGNIINDGDSEVEVLEDEVMTSHRSMLLD